MRATRAFCCAPTRHCLRLCCPAPSAAPGAFVLRHSSVRYCPHADPVLPHSHRQRAPKPLLQLLPALGASDAGPRRRQHGAACWEALGAGVCQSQRASSRLAHAGASDCRKRERTHICRQHIGFPSLPSVADLCTLPPLSPLHCRCRWLPATASARRRLSTATLPSTVSGQRCRAVLLESGAVDLCPRDHTPRHCCLPQGVLYSSGKGFCSWPASSKCTAALIN